MGYVVVDDGETPPSPEELRALVRRLLPDYMVPTAFLRIPELPLTPNGKLDRRALPAPEWGRPALSGPRVAPRSELERELTRLWEAALGVEPVGIHDAFLDLGGDSLRAAQLVNTLQARLGETLYVTALFEAPTVADLAGYLERHYADSVDRLLGRVGGAEIALPPIHADQVAALRRCIPALPRRATNADLGPRNGPAVFLLSAPRSGST